MKDIFHSERRNT